MSALVAGFEGTVEFVYPDAPKLASGSASWWNALDALPAADGAPSVGAKHYEGWEQTRAWAIAYFAQQGPFDGVFGFSQGAALTALLVGLRAFAAVPTADRPLLFNRAMLISGFVSNDPKHAELYESKRSFELPSLHLIGRSDRIVPRAASLALAARFAAPTVVEHDGGHVIASNAEVRDALATFLSRTSG